MPKMRTVAVLLALVSVALVSLIIAARRECDGARLRSETEAILIAKQIVKEKNLANFPELGGSNGFSASLSDALDCCGAHKQFSFTYLMNTWDVYLNIKNREPRYHVYLVLNECGMLLYSGKLRWD